MGTGDQANARSSYSGKGVFKSLDAGKTWQLTGLTDSHHIARIVIHPRNPDVVYVAAIGHLFSRNEERGVFRTVDAGKTWKKVLYVNDGVGAIDLVINRRSPATVYAAMYDNDRRPWQIVRVVQRARSIAQQRRPLAAARRGLAHRQDRPHRPRPHQHNPLIPPSSRTERQDRRPDGSRKRHQSATAGIIGNERIKPTTAGRRGGSDRRQRGGRQAPYSFNRINPHNDQTVIVTSDSMHILRDGGKTGHQLLPRVR